MRLGVPERVLSISSGYIPLISDFTVTLIDTFELVWEESEPTLSKSYLLRKDRCLQLVRQLQVHDAEKRKGT